MELSILETPSLLNPRLKVSRAEELTDELLREINSFSYLVIVRTSEDRRVHTYSVVPERPFPPRWSLLVGDVIHNLRSALDQLVYQLTRVECDPVPPEIEKSSSFPIVGKQTDWIKRSDRSLRGVSNDAVKIIESLQPFHVAEPTAHSLAILERLDNNDKHRRLNVATGLVRSVELNPFDSRIKEQSFSFRQIGEGVEWKRVVFHEPQEVDTVEAPERTVVLLDEPTNSPSIADLLPQLCSFVRSDVLNKFRPWLVEPKREADPVQVADQSMPNRAERRRAERENPRRRRP